MFSVLPAISFEVAAMLLIALSISLELCACCSLALSICSISFTIL
jgi:hypothetical protein